MRSVNWPRLRKAAVVAAALLPAAVLLYLLGSSLYFAAEPLAAAENPGEELFFTILHTNDEHADLIPHSPAVDFHPELPDPTVGGFARLATAVKGIRERKAAEGEPVLLLNAGDFIGGSAFSWLVPLGYTPELTLMQLLGYDAVIIGNHEYDYGTDHLAAYLLAAGYPEAHAQTVVLAGNARVPAGHPLADKDLFRKTHLTVLENGLKVGLFSLIGRAAVAVTASPEPVEFGNQLDTAREAIAELQAQGAQVIIAITHSGVEEDLALARDLPGLHLIVGGHCHTALYEPLVENGVIIAQAGSLLQYLGQLEFAYTPRTGELRMRNRENNQPYLVKIDDSFPLDPVFSDVVGRYTAELNSLVYRETGGRFQHILETVALSAFPLPDKPPLQETPFGNFVTDAMRIVTSRKIGKRVDIALQANGSIRGGVIPGTMAHAEGRVSFYELTKLMGLGIGPDGKAGYPLVSFYLTGDEIRRLLEVAVLLGEMMGDAYFLQFSGLRYDYNPQNAILFTVPFLNQPLPSAVLPGNAGAVIRAELYTGDGPQGEGGEGYVPLEWGDQELYHVVTDTYILKYLPMVGRMLPMLNLELKDADGNPVPHDRFDDHIVMVDGEELKGWQALVEYAAAQPPNPAGIPQIDRYYSDIAGRINPAKSFPLVAWPVLLLVALFGLPVFLVSFVRRRRRRKVKTA